MNKQNLDFYLEKLRRESPVKNVFFDDEAALYLLSRGFAMKENVQNDRSFDLFITDQGRSFEGFIKEEENNEKEKRRDELNERAVKSAETSAEAAKESAKAVNKANTISVIAIVISIISLLLSIFLK